MEFDSWDDHLDLASSYRNIENCNSVYFGETMVEDGRYTYLIDFLKTIRRDGNQRLSFQLKLGIH